MLRLDHLERDPKLRHGRALLVLDLRRDVALVDVLRVLAFELPSPRKLDELSRIEVPRLAAADPYQKSTRSCQRLCPEE